MADNRTKKINTKKKFVADGVFQAELNEFLQKTLGMDGYAGIEIRAPSVNTEIRVRAAKAADLIQQKTRKVKEIKSLIEKRYNFNDSDNENVIGATTQLAAHPQRQVHSRLHPPEAAPPARVAQRSCLLGARPVICQPTG